MNSRARVRLLAGATSFSLLAVGAAGQAVAAESAAPLVLLHVAADEPVAQALEERLRPRLSALGVALAVDVTATVDVDAVLGTVANLGIDAPLAEIWLDGRPAAEATLFLVPRLADRVLARRIALAPGVDEVALAEIVYIVERSVTTLLADQPLGVPKEEARALLRPAAAAPAAPAVAVSAPPSAGSAARPPGPPSFQVGAFLGSQAWSDDDTIVPQVGVTAILEGRRKVWRVGLGLDGQLRRAFAAPRADATLNVSGGTTHLLLTLGRSFGNLGTGRLQVGPGFALTSVAATPTPSPRHVVAQSRTDVDLAIEALLRWDVPLGPHFSVFSAAGLDVVPVSGRYTAVVDGVSHVLLTAWPVRPTFLVGVAFGVR